MSVANLSFIKPAINDHSTPPSVVIISSNSELKVDKPAIRVRTLIAGKRWHYFLKPRESSKSKSLFEAYSETELADMLVVCYEPTEDVRLYSAFKDYLEFYAYSNKFLDEAKFFHEVILADADQKPRFDIDIKDVEDIKAVSQGCIDELITCLISEMKEIGVTIHLERDILLFNSSDSKKGSFHLIVDNHKHPNHVEARTLAHRIIGRMKDYKSYIDDQIYSSKHNLRIVDSYKHGTFRQKRWMPSFTYLGQTITHQWTTDLADENLSLAILEHSLITASASCTLLPILNKEVKTVVKRSNLPNDVVDRALEIFFEKQGESRTLKLAEVVGSMIILRKQSKYNCLKCNSSHENENPFLSVTDKGGVYYNCRRKPGGLHIGWILGGVQDNIITSNDVTPKSDGSSPHLRCDGEFTFFRQPEVAPPATEQLMRPEDIFRSLSKAKPLFDPLAESTAKQPAVKGSFVDLAADYKW